MLRFLRIRRLAVIEAVDVEFASGLNVLTGETGAGKSILVEAVGLLLGGRASADLVRTGEDTASIEAVFERDGGELIVRREISAQGRSRAFVNGDLVTAAALKEQTGGLIELHGQHEHHVLLDPASHLGVLDAFGDLASLAAPVAESHRRWRAAVDALAEARQRAATREERLDLVAFQLSELDRADLKPNEDEELAQLRQVLASADRVQRLCSTGYAALYERDGSILGELNAVWRQVAELAAIDPSFNAYLEGRDAIKAQLEDLAGFLRHYGDRIDASPARLQQVEERLALIERLKRKHGPQLERVLNKRLALRQEASDLAHAGERVAELESEEASRRTAFLEAAERLSAARKAAAAPFARGLERHLSELAMEKARFEVRFSAEPADPARWTSSGIDEAEFFVSPNPGEDVRPLARVASGGELSRIMLAIKTLSSGGRGPGLIFDEVDAGIGGRVADVVGGKLKRLGRGVQVLCITHLPQIAACADAHFHVAKRVAGGRTVVSVHPLAPDERVDEIGRMLGGSPITAAIRASAVEMLETRSGRSPEKRGESESKPKGESETATRTRAAGPARPSRGAQ